MRRIFIVLFIFFSLNTFWGRTWTTRGGEEIEGELYKFSSANGLSIMDGKRKVTVIAFRNISRSDLQYISDNYPDFSAATGLRPIVHDEISDNPNKVEWPKICVDKDSVSFRWDTSHGKFHTRHFVFDMKKAITQEDALKLALQCESSYECVHAIPFWSDKFKRKSANIGLPRLSSNRKSKFQIEIDSSKNLSMTVGNAIGVYLSSYDNVGYLKVDEIKIDADAMERMFKEKRLGVLGHEITHQILSLYGGSIMIKEGIAQYVQYATYENGIAEVKKIGGFLKAGLKINGKTGSLKKFMTLSTGGFYNDNIKDNYTLAFLVLTYFAESEPENFKNFLDKILFSDDKMHSDMDCREKLRRNFSALLGRRTEVQLESDIKNFYKKYNVQIDF